MIIKYSNDKIANICTNPEYARRFYQPKLVDRLKTLMSILTSIDNLSAFTKPPLSPYHLEWLKGEKNLMSLRIDRQYRLEFESVIGKNEYIKITAIEIGRISNHYGD